MHRYKIIVAYDGTDYAGWQVQPGLPSVAKTLQDSFYKVFSRKIALRVSSRTDAGVHAFGNVATFKTDLQICPDRMRHAWTNKLPDTIVIRKIEHVPLDFNPHACVTHKTYWYHFSLDRPLPFKHRYSAYFRYPVDIEKLQHALQVFVGTHDFRSFCTGDEREDTVRTITAVSVVWTDDYSAYRIAISGPKFLKYMVRRVVGACLDVASKPSLPVTLLQETLEAKNPEHTLPKAPAKGLMLYEVCYRKEHDE